MLGVVLLMTRILINCEVVIGLINTHLVKGLRF